MYTATVPDTITSWVASAFALSNVAGLGISPETAKVRLTSRLANYLNVRFFMFSKIVFLALETTNDKRLVTKMDLLIVADNIMITACLLPNRWWRCSLS